MNIELLNKNEAIEAQRRSAELSQRYKGFPEGLTFNEFQTLSPELKKLIILRNPILHTDSYNRTMEHVEGEDWKKEATYALQFRKAEKGYIIVAGTHDLFRKIADIEITRDQVDFARDYFEQVAGINYFNAEKWNYIIEEHGGKLPLKIDSLKEGSAVLPGDPILRVSGPNEIVAHFEPYFHHIFYQSLVATNAHEIARRIGPDRFIEVGLRGVETEEKHLMALKAMYIGGGLRYTSSDLAAAYYPQFKLVGTMGHRYVQSYESEEAAFRKAIESLDSVSLLVDLNNSMNGIDLAIALKKEYRETGKGIWIRLDSGNVLEQLIYALKRQNEEGLSDPTRDKVVVEGIETIQDMVEIDRAIESLGIDAKSFVIYGAGGLLVSEDTQRCDASTGFKLAKIGDKPTMKFSDSKDKASIPGMPTIILRKGIREIAQLGELGNGRSLYFPMYRDGALLSVDNIEGARINAQQTFDLIKHKVQEGQTTELSYQTKLLIADIRRKAFERGSSNGNGKVGMEEEKYIFLG